MRVVIGKALRVQPGDEVVVRAALKPTASLGRLFVFARELTEPRFSPYVKQTHGIVVGERPAMFSPLSLRLVREMPERELSFFADIDGYICITQEVDTAKDARAKVKLKRIIPPHLDRKEWLRRKIVGIFSWPTKIAV